MAFVNGCIVVDAPASALNNSGEPIQGARTENTVAVKYIPGGRDGNYPYVSGQAVRYWLRTTLEDNADIEWKKAPIYRGNKVAFTDANPIFYWDDDLLGYMRAPAKKDHEDIIERLEELGLTPQETDNKGNPQAITRVSPFRVGTLVSLEPTRLVGDFGTMSRQEGDPTPHEHQFYRTLLHSLFSLDMRQVGTFYYRHRTGFRNLDDVRTALASERGLEQNEDERYFRLTNDERVRRIRSLLIGLGRLQGGAKQAIHYTDVSPAATIFAVIRGGSNPFHYVFRYDEAQKQVIFDSDVFRASVEDLLNNNRLLSSVYVGWKPGFLPQERVKMEAIDQDTDDLVRLSTPESAFVSVADHIYANVDSVLDE